MKSFEIEMHDRLEQLVGKGVVGVNASLSDILWREKEEGAYFTAISCDLATQTCLQPLTRWPLLMPNFSKPQVALRAGVLQMRRVEYRYQWPFNTEYLHSRRDRIRGEQAGTYI